MPDSVTLWPAATRLLCPWDFPGKNTGVCCHFPSPGDLPDQEIEPESPVSPASAGGFFSTLAPGQSMGRKELDMTNWLFFYSGQSHNQFQKRQLKSTNFFKPVWKMCPDFHWKLVHTNQPANIYHMPTVCKVLWAQRFHAGFHDPVVPVLCSSITGNN